MSLGGYHSAGITQSGILYTWGYGGDGQLGQGHLATLVHPTQVITDTYVTTAPPTATHKALPGPSWIPSKDRPPTRVAPAASCLRVPKQADITALPLNTGHGLGGPQTSGLWRLSHGGSHAKRPASFLGLWALWHARPSDAWPSQCQQSFAGRSRRPAYSATASRRGDGTGGQFASV